MIAMLIKCVNPGYACRTVRALPPSTDSAAAAPPSATARTPTAGAPQALAAAWLDPRDDVATALRPLAAGTRVQVAVGGGARTVTVVESIALGHKFALHGIAAGRRVRKYGECIGRTTHDVAAGAWVHVHNLVTTATRSDADEHAWRTQAAPALGVRVLPGTASGEGASPAYDEAAGRLYWLDAAAPVVHVHDDAQGAVADLSLPRPAHVLVLQEDGTLVVGTGEGLFCVDPRSGALRALAATTPPATGMRWTGAACDAQGRPWLAAADLAHADTAGTLSSPVPGSAPRGTACPGAPTGLAATGDGRALVLVDAARAIVDRLAVDGSGDLGVPCTFADAGALPGELWGAAFDAEGGLWCALRDAGCVLRFAVDGTISRVVRLPVARPTGLAFAGPGLRELVVTTAAGDGDAAGRTLALDVGVTGAAPRRVARSVFAGTHA